MKKICKKCKIEKDFDDFYKHSEMTSGYVNFCKKCQRERIANNPKDDALCKIAVANQLTYVPIIKLSKEFEKAGLIIMEKTRWRYNIIVTPKCKRVLKLIDEIVREIEC